MAPPKESRTECASDLDQFGDSLAKSFRQSVTKEALSANQVFVSVVRGPLRGSNGFRIHKDTTRDPSHLSPNLMIGSALTTDY